MSTQELIPRVHPFSFLDFARVDWQKYAELLDDPVAAIIDPIEDNWKFLVLANIFLKYLKSMRVGQIIKRIITRNIYPMSQLIFWPLASNMGP